MKHVVQFATLLKRAHCVTVKHYRAKEYKIRDQIVIGSNNETMHKRAMSKNWNVLDLCQNVMKYEDGAAGEERISGAAITKLCS